MLYVNFLTFVALLVESWTARASMELQGCYRDDCGADGDAIGMTGGRRDADGVAEEKIGAN